MFAMPYVFGMVVFAVSDSVEVAVFTAIIAGVFSVINTCLNGYMARKLSKMDTRQQRAMSILGERSEDGAEDLASAKSTPRVGRNRIGKNRRKA